MNLSRAILIGSAAISFVACSEAGMASSTIADIGAKAQSSSIKPVVDYDLSKLTKSEQQNVVVMEFDRAPKDIFPLLLERVDLYDDTVETVTFNHNMASTPGQLSIGSARICTFKDGKVLVEPIAVYEPFKAYAYSVDPNYSTRKLPITDVLLFYTFEKTGSGGTRVVVRAHYTPADAAMAPMIQQGFGEALGKTFAEAGSKFGGRVISVN